MAFDSQAETHSLTEIAEFARLSDEAKAILIPRLTAGIFMGQLVDAGLYVDALRLAGFTLPTRQGVWWGCVCAGHVLGPFPPAATEAALTAAMDWVMNPNETTRRHAEKSGRSVGMDDAAGCMAMAAFFSEGSVAPADLPAVDPRPFQAQKALLGGIVIASTLGKPEEADDRRKTFLNYAIEIASGSRHWPRR